MIIFFLALAYLIFRLNGGFKRFSNIKIVLDERYDNIWDISLAAIVHLEKEGKKCKLLRREGGEYPRIVVNEKLYYLTYKTIMNYGIPTQVIYLYLDKIKEE